MPSLRVPVTNLRARALTRADAVRNGPADRRAPAQSVAGRQRGIEFGFAVRGSCPRTAAASSDKMPSSAEHRQCRAIRQQRGVFVVGAPRRSAAPGRRFVVRFARGHQRALRSTRAHGSEQLRSGSSSSLASVGLCGHSCRLRRQSYSNRRYIFHQKACFAALRINA